MHGRRCASIEMESMYHCTCDRNHRLAFATGSFTLWNIQGIDFEFVVRVIQTPDGQSPSLILMFQNQWKETEFFGIIICYSHSYFGQFCRFHNWPNDSNTQNHFRNWNYDKSTMRPLTSCFIGMISRDFIHNNFTIFRWLLHQSVCCHPYPLVVSLYWFIWPV